MKMETNCTKENGVNGTGTSSESASLGRVVVGTAAHSRSSKWNKEMNKIVMRCFIKSESSKRGYKKRMIGIWKEIGVFEVKQKAGFLK